MVVLVLLIAFVLAIVCLSLVVGVDDLAILAVKPNNGRWKKREFLQQYPWIYYDLKEHLFMVSKRNGERVMLFDWLNRIEK